ncbi:MAG: GGDEF domain-containing protein [Nitrospirae bacterium]|nr:GGDEF domain-containing protein [Nitrospirota bacterium]
MTIAHIANGMLAASLATLAAALVPVRHLMRELPVGTIRRRWYAMTVLIVLFMVAYAAFTALFQGTLLHLDDLIVPTVFLLGACFVWLTAHLSFLAAMDVRRISLLERENITDPLTGVHNRRHMEARLAEEIARSRRYGMPLSVILFDIDHFKRINDAYGHQVGDNVLTALGRLATNALHQADIVTRYGGEEFLVIAPSTNLDEAVSAAERLRQKVADHAFVAGAGDDPRRVIPVTVSMGVACLAGLSESRDGLLMRADIALYRAKAAGRDRVERATGQRAAA